MIRAILIGIIRFYQVILSPLKGPSCRFVPTCSQYAIEAISHHGPIRGLMLATSRLLRCHPFHPGGYDPVVRKPGPSTPDKVME